MYKVNMFKYNVNKLVKAFGKLIGFKFVRCYTIGHVVICFINSKKINKLFYFIKLMKYIK